MHKALATSPLFSGIEMEKARMCLECSGARITLHPKDGLIFDENSPPVCLYVLLEGAVTVLRQFSEGRKAVIAHIDRAGDLFGAAYVFLDHPFYGCSVIVEEAASVLAIPGHFFYGTCKKTCSAHSRLIKNMLGIFASKNILLSQRVTLLSMGNLRQKLAFFLLQNRHSDGSVSLAMNREQMADYLGVTRPSISRELAAMHREGLLERHGRKLHIPDAELLQNFCKKNIL